MILFTKQDCARCEYIKDGIDLDNLGISVEVLTPDNTEGLARLAWHELVKVAESSLPILVFDNGGYVAGSIEVKKYLKKCKPITCTDCDKGFDGIYDFIYYVKGEHEPLCKECRDKRVDSKNNTQKDTNGHI